MILAYNQYRIIISLNTRQRSTLQERHIDQLQCWLHGKEFQILIAMRRYEYWGMLTPQSLRPTQCAKTKQLLQPSPRLTRDVAKQMVSPGGTRRVVRKLPKKLRVLALFSDWLRSNQRPFDSFGYNNT